MNYNQLLTQYLEADKAEKQAKAIKEQLKPQIIKLSSSESSDQFEVKIINKQYDSIESIKAITDKSRSLMAALHAAGCIKQIKSTSLSVQPMRPKASTAV